MLKYLYLSNEDFTDESLNKIINIKSDLIYFLDNGGYECILLLYKEENQDDVIKLVGSNCNEGINHFKEYLEECTEDFTEYLKEISTLDVLASEYATNTLKDDHEENIWKNRNNFNKAIEDYLKEKDKEYDNYCDSRLK